MIGVFDSGFGGLTTLKELLHYMPNHDYLYLGDSARAPYGNRSVESVIQCTEQGVEFLFKKGASVVLIACNTASSDALKYLQEKYGSEKKVLGVLIPTIETALENTRYGRIGLVATRGTVLAGNFEKELEKKWNDFYRPTEKKAQKKPSLSSQACPLLVPLIEEGWIKKPETKMILKKYVLPLKTHNIDTLILGCTHYPLLEKAFAKKMGKNCVLINSGKAQAEKFISYLRNHPEISTVLSQNKHIRFFTTDCPHRFQKLGQKFLGRGIGEVEKIEV